MIPLINQLNKERHRQVAIAQDFLITELYRFFPQAVFHGGTAIWRCFHGGRFSEDLDVYIEKDKDQIERLFTSLQQKGMNVIKKKVSANSLYSKIEFDRHIVSLEAVFKKVKGTLAEYEKVDGNILMVYSLTSNQFIEEKVEAYLGRKKIRDLYDIFFLLSKADRLPKVVDALQKLLAEFSLPEDETDLKSILLEGAMPDSKNMIEYIRRWVQKNI